MANCAAMSTKPIADTASLSKQRERSRFYLPALDALRGIACFLIVAVHIEQHKIGAGLPHVADINRLYNIGRPGLMMFFVLSGFLITLLLLKERNATGDISYKNFYLKRVLRIWPLYYLVLLLSSLIWHYHPPPLTLILCVTILPNIAYYLGVPWETSPPQWSVGVEEQFYLFWPLVVNNVRKYLLPVLIVFVIGYTLLPHFLLFTMNRIGQPHPDLEKFIGRFFYGTKFNFLALGGIAAYVWHSGYRPKLLKNRIVYNIVLIVPFICWFTGFYPPIFGDEMHGVLFAVLIFHLATMENPPYALTNPVAVYLGRISYGIYMYHYTVLMVAFAYILNRPFSSSWQFNVTAYVVIYGLTLGTASLSFHTFERFFLSLKERLQPKTARLP